MLQILLFLLSGGGTRHQTGDPKAPRDVLYRSLLRCTSHGQDQSWGNADKGCKHTEFVIARAQQSPEHWALNKHANKTNTHCHKQLPAYSQQGREGSCKATCAPSPNNIKHDWASGPPPHCGSLSHDTHLFSLSIGFCDPVVNHNPLGRSPGISRRISPEKLKSLSLQILPDPTRPDEIRLRRS